MRQLTYTLDEHLSLEEMLTQVSAHPDFVAASSRLQIVFEPNCDQKIMRERITDAMRILPDTISVGMTTLGSTNPELEVPRHPVCTFLLFEHSELHVDVFDCHQMDILEAGREYAHQLSRYSDLKGILCISSCAMLCPAPFIDAISLYQPDVPIFGTQAGTLELNDDHSVFFVGGQIYDRGVLAVAFCGEDLHIQTNYNLGWRPIGKDLLVTGYEGDGFVSTIDNEQAVSIYRRYLNVVPDGYFFENVCSFPLLMQSGRRTIARVPLDYTHDGMLQFTMTVEKGSHLRFSYTKPEYLLRESLAAANEIAEFQPQGMLLFACLNRRVFLGNDNADREFTYYEHACPDMAWAYGYGEILRTTEGGGILNSTIVAVGFREGACASETIEPLHDPSIETITTSIPLPERLVTFLEATTSELNETIDELATLAERDQLTGVYNRRRMDELIRYELSKRHQADDLVLVMYDVDYFKRINDTYGHDTGDIILKDLTTCVQRVIRSGDTLCRWGGEEFLCLLTNTSLHQAQFVAERIRSRVENTDFPIVGQVTISLGITAMEMGDTSDTLFQRVDKALYDAKHAGRNCVRVR